MASDATRTAILDAAEALFAEVGYDGCSLRELTRRAGVNLAAVHYHFGGKDELAKAVMQRRIEPVNEQRFRQLDELTAAGAPLPPTAILRALLEPALALASDPNGPGACAMFGRLVAEQPPFLRPWLAAQIRPVIGRFAAALSEALPQLPPDEILWRLHFVVGAMAHTMQHAHLLAELSDGACDAGDHHAITERLVAFATAGFVAPAAHAAAANAGSGSEEARS